MTAVVEVDVAVDVDRIVDLDRDLDRFDEKSEITRWSTYKVKDGDVHVAVLRQGQGRPQRLRKDDPGL
ncbi:MAG TPA: hypothetical protein VFK02_18855 [Kofleriaceae bacterium]|nr:hypothetical protein [Kofleriaceae bacterium]